MTTPPATRRSPFRFLRPLVVLVLAGVAAEIAGAAAPEPGGPAGEITGRIYNPATGEFVRNAEVSVRGRPDVGVSGDDGAYRLAGVPAGEATVVVTYTGHPAAVVVVTVPAGQTVTRDIDLVSAPAEATAAMTADEILKLAAFTVSSEREGNAKAIMEQRNSMNITNTVASDVFGDVAEGNVGEFLKNLPGVDMWLVQGEIVNVRLRGLGSEYNSVTMDGMELASADANKGAAGDARAFSFEQVSLSSLDSIEVSKTISADVDANAPAGTINLKSKRAFSRAGRRVAGQANLTALAGESSFRALYGPDDARHRRIRPGGMLEYSDVFLDRRLGVVLSVSESNLYSENARANVTYSFTPTAADPRPVVPTAVALYQSPRLNRRSTVTLTTDFKATPRLVLSLGLIYNASSLYNIQRTETFTATNRAAVVGPEPLTSFTATGRVTTNPSAVVKPGETYTAMPRFEYKLGGLTVEGRFAASDSKSWYNPLARKGSARSAGSPQLENVGVRADRSSVIRGDWQILQTSGPDLADGAGYSNRVLAINDGRFGRTQVYSGELTASWRTGGRLPITWKAGAKQKRQIRDFLNDEASKNYTYTGPGAGTGVWASYNSPFRFNSDATDGSMLSSSGGAPFVPNLLAIGRLFQEHPDYFTRSLTAANYYSAYVANTRHYAEDVGAGFLMGTSQIGRLLVRAGLRWEGTGTDSFEFDPRTAAELHAAGLAEANGRATTVPGLEYQFFSKPKIHRTGSYDNWFPSASVKYRFTPNFDLHLGYSSTIRRPTIRDLAGVWVINDDAFTVSAPNPGLKPETSDNFAARLAYYFEPVGIAAINLFQNTVHGLHRTDQMTAAEFGNTDPELAGYLFTSTIASAEQVVIRGAEFEYRQSLSFLPRPFKGLDFRASYTRNYAQVVYPQMSPHAVNAGLTYSLGRVTTSVSGSWRDNVPTSVDGTTFNRHRVTIDVGGSVKLSSRFSLFISGRNIRSEPVITLQQVGANPAVSQVYEVTGAIWTAGVKGVW